MRTSHSTLSLPFIISAIILFIAFPLQLLSQASQTPASKAAGQSRKKSPNIIQGRFKGYNLCLGCYLNKKTGSLHQPEKFGHQMAFRIKSVQSDAHSRMKAADGWFVTYLLNDKSYGLFAPEVQNKAVIIKGTLHIKERTMEVDAFRVIESGTTAPSSGNDEPTPQVEAPEGQTPVSSTDVLSDSSKPWYYDRLKAVKDQP